MRSVARWPSSPTSLSLVPESIESLFENCESITRLEANAAMMGGTPVEMVEPDRMMGAGVGLLLKSILPGGWAFDPAPNRCSFIDRVRSGYGLCLTVLQTRLV